jgi:hypothetical protein
MGAVMVKKMALTLKWLLGTIDGLFTTFVGLFERKEHGLEMLETRALFIELVKALATVPREVLFGMLPRFGLPDHFIKVLLRLRLGAKVKAKIGEEDSEVNGNSTL